MSGGVGDSGGGRSDDAGGRRETYMRRHDPAAPGSTLPTYEEAFRHHSGIGTPDMTGGKYTTGQNVARTILGAVIPGGMTFLGLQAHQRAKQDVGGLPGSFQGTGMDQNLTLGSIDEKGRGTLIRRPDEERSNSDDILQPLKKLRRPLTPGQPVAGTAKTTAQNTGGTRLSASTISLARNRDRRLQGRSLISGTMLGIQDEELQRTLV
jgi:hypothetical protein